jgi:transcription initiation factor IIE alpha subunit
LILSRASLSPYLMTTVNITSWWNLMIFFVTNENKIRPILFLLYQSGSTFYKRKVSWTEMQVTLLGIIQFQKNISWHLYCKHTPKTLNYLTFQSFHFERTWWRLFQKRVMCINFDIYENKIRPILFLLYQSGSTFYKRKVSWTEMQVTLLGIIQFQKHLKSKIGSVVHLWHKDTCT